MAPDPLKIDSYNHRYLTTNNQRYHFVDEGPKDGVVLFFAHGFPDFWYGWRYQVAYFSSIGYRCIAPDFRGYGDSKGPYVPHDDLSFTEQTLSLYRIKNICNDVTGLLDLLGIKRVVMIGHDWGGFFVWRYTQHFPSRVIAVASLCTNYNPPNKTYVSVDDLVRIYPNWAYQQFFCRKGSDKLLEDNVEAYFKYTLRGVRDEPTPPNSDPERKVTSVDMSKITYPKMITKVELDNYVAAYTRAGFNGGLAWYRTRKMNHDDDLSLPDSIDHQALMVTAGKDPALSPSMAKKMPRYIKNLKMLHIEESAHWVQVEHRDEINRILKGWLTEIGIGAKVSKL
ncbi:alpha/beta-hydrolase [Gonapodya prolifera JEL478]|uniref:Alpha/beta-hydrolase n=1 Tax=Gonapodya prolifera (strain JEL478) TaxID=1344416 RepID=A0A139ALE7_GONPJ|nr:alpha/beta-hydrolase [Gonapodya prolifera JEL478]|eukprot:KXS17612.1 alpha/beta-hydrolase [Gonapodya prolifera JEL478]